MNASPTAIDDDPLCEQDLVGTDRPLSPLAQEFLDAGRKCFKTIDVFAFVPSNYELLWGKLDALPRGRFCEFGSGFGLATGLAEILGFDAVGVEISSELVGASRKLLSQFGLNSRIQCGDYLERRDEADVYFVYSWPSQIGAIERLFAEIAPPQAKLLICYGQDDVRCKIRKT